MYKRGVVSWKQHVAIETLIPSVSSGRCARMDNAGPIHRGLTPPLNRDVIVRVFSARHRCTMTCG